VKKPVVSTLVVLGPRFTLSGIIQKLYFRRNFSRYWCFL